MGIKNQEEKAQSHDCVKFCKKLYVYTNMLSSAKDQMAITYYQEKLAQLSSKLWSWWSEGSNHHDIITTSLITFFTVVVLIIWYTWIIKKSSKGKLPLPPGPRGLPLVGNLLSLDPELHTYFAKLAQTYGPIYKLQLGGKLAIVISSPSVAKEVLKDHDINFANRDVPAAGKSVGKDILWSPYGPEWRMLRKICVREMLGNASLDAVYTLRHREVRRMVRSVYSKRGSPINVGEEMFLTIMNVITSMMWGDTIKGDEGTSLGAEFRQVVGEITDLSGKPNVSDFFPALGRFDLQGIQRKIGGLFARFDKIFETIIEQRLKMEEGERKETKDFLQLMLQLVKGEADAKTPFTMVHVKALLMDMVVGGTGTTSNSLEWAVAELINKPETIKIAQAELESIVGKDNIVEESHLPMLPYLQMVMKEVLRLHPVLPLLVPHSPNSSCDIGGYMVPKGSRVFIHAWAIHRDPTMWVNPSEFNPERFLGGKFDFSGNDFNYFPFGSGRRICVGIPMAERMFMYELATLLHSFNWKLEDGVKKIDLTEKFGIVLKKATPLVAVPTPRSSCAALYA